MPKAAAFVAPFIGTAKVAALSGRQNGEKRGGGFIALAVIRNTTTAITVQKHSAVFRKLCAEKKFQSRNQTGNQKLPLQLHD